MASKRQGSRSRSGGGTMGSQLLSVATSFDNAKNEYRASKASSSRFVSASLGSAALGVGANVHTTNDASYFQMMELFRHLEMNDRLVGVGVRRLVTNVLQQGMTINPRTENVDANKVLKRKFDAWASNKNKCDILGKFTFHQMAKLVLRRIVVDGDIFCLPQPDLTLQFAEAHRCRTPINMQRRTSKVIPIHGVEHNEATGAVRKYHFTKVDVDLRQQVLKVDEVTAKSVDKVHHMMLAERFTQSRGVGYLARVPTEPGQYDDAVFAKLVATQVQSCFAIIEQIEVGGEPGNDDELLGGSEAQTGAWNKSEVEISPGMIFPGKPGRSYKPFSPNINMADFKEFSRMILGTIAVNLDIPLIVLLLDASETNFSGWRGALDQARMRFRELQQEMIEQFYTPTYEWLVRAWIKDDPQVAELYKLLGDDIFNHTWNRPQFKYVEPLKDTTADALQLGTMMTSPVEFQGSKGRDWNEFYPEVVDAYGDAIEAACERVEKINNKYKFANVVWRDVLPIPVAKGLKITVMTGDDPEDSDDPKPEPKPEPTSKPEPPPVKKGEDDA